MGPFERIVSTSKKHNGPKRSNQQQHLPMQWAHLSASAVPPRNILGQNKAIGSSICQCNGPIQMHHQCLPKIYWAKVKKPAAPSANKMGPPRATPKNLMEESNANMRRARN